MSDSLYRALRLFEQRHGYCMVGKPAEETGCLEILDSRRDTVALVYPNGEAVAALLNEAHEIAGLYAEAADATAEADRQRERAEDLEDEIEELRDAHADEVSALRDEIKELKQRLDDALADRDDLAAELERLRGM